jgi:voltage-gated potassium channel
MPQVLEQPNPSKFKIKDTKVTFLNIVILVLSLYVIGVMLYDISYSIPDETSKVIDYFDNVICVIFFIDFCIRFKNAENKLQFMKWGWLDLISCIPAVDLFRFGRVFRILRLVKAFRSLKYIINHIFADRKEGAFTSMFVFTLLIIIFSSISILHFETHPDSNIKTAEDAIWWVYVTITTVGYGDRYPVTSEGRFIAAILMTTGVGMFGTFSGFIAGWVMNHDKDE